MISLTNAQWPVPVDVADFINAGGFGKAVVRKTVTFANTAGNVALFTVTGDVIVRTIAVCQTSCVSGAGCTAQVGIAGSLLTILPVTDITLLAAGEIWTDSTPTSNIETMVLAMQDHVIAGGADILMTLSAQADSGVIAFYAFWTACSLGATVVAA